MKTTLSNEEQNEAVEWFKSIIRFKTISFEGPETGEYLRCVKWLDYLVKQQIPGCHTEILEYVENKPILFVTIKGELSGPKECILLNSHYDVVPVMLEHWNVDPFDAVEKDGKIYGRGTQDMKCVCIQYIAVLSKMVKALNGNKLRRTVYLTFVPDEEVGGGDGMGKFIDSEFFQKDLKPRIGVAFDEGLANIYDKYTVFYGERVPLWVTIIAKGPTGHGSRFVENTAVERLIKISNDALKLRQQQKDIYEGKCDDHALGCSHGVAKKLGDVLTLNLTMLQAGVTAGKGGKYSLNVIPTEAKAGFDIRVPVSMPLRDVYSLLDTWTKDEGLSWEFSTPHPGYEHHVSAISGNNVSPFWKEFLKVFEELQILVEPEIFPAGTDSRLLREQGITAFGFSPMKNSPVLLHEHNEYLEKKVFLEGIEVYLALFKKLI